MMDKVLARLQNFEIIEEEGEFFLISPEDVAASAEENKRSYIDKLVSDWDVNIQAPRHCLCRTWRRLDFKICKIDVSTYQFYFKDLDTVMAIVSREPWMVDDHLPILQPWQESYHHRDEDFYL